MGTLWSWFFQKSFVTSVVPLAIRTVCLSKSYYQCTSVVLAVLHSIEFSAVSGLTSDYLRFLTLAFNKLIYVGQAYWVLAVLSSFSRFQLFTPEFSTKYELVVTSSVWQFFLMLFRIDK
jgi:hypothetical protein